MFSTLAHMPANCFSMSLAGALPLFMASFVQEDHLKILGSHPEGIIDWQYSTLFTSILVGNICVGANERGQCLSALQHDKLDRRVPALGQARLDMMLNLLKFNTLAVELDLGVFASKVCKCTVKVVAHQVSSLVELASHVRSQGHVFQEGRRRNKRLGHLLGQVEVAARNNGTINEEFSHTTDRNQATMIGSVDYPSDTADSTANVGSLARLSNFTRSAEARGHLGRDQRDGSTCVFSTKSNGSVRMSWIQWNTSTTGLQNSKHGHDGKGRLVKADEHKGLNTHT
ncbi:hypothetical protein HG530_001551 [Fusarium avenaceum]|nr:hypothetical protein HG530_001551 [Fusarium avenaceum]